MAKTADRNSRADGATAPNAQRELPRVSRRPLLSGRRVAVGWLLGVGGAAVLTVALTTTSERIGLPSILLLYVLLVVATSAVGGTWPALTTAFGSSLLVNWYFTPPFHTFTIKHTQNVVALVVFVVAASLVSGLVSSSARRAQEARRARSEAEILARAAGALLGTEDPVGELVERLRSAFGLRAVALLRRASSSWRVEAHSGTPCPTAPERADLAVKLSDDAYLALVGAKLSTADRRVLDAFAVQLAAAMQSERLRAEATAAQELAAANELRTALLAGVSHDLRTPLSSIKASVTSLLQEEVDWPAETIREFLRTIDTETDRLNKIVGNLLDMSRLRTGGVKLTLRGVGLEEVVGGALTGLGYKNRSVDVDVSESLPLVRADPALLERALANIVDNAIAHAPLHSGIVVHAEENGNDVRLSVIDRGPGIPPDERDKAFEPFQRLGDAGGTGVGLGLAVARGFVEAMGGRLTLEDTPGGGLTVNVDLAAFDR
jgi:two-component system sensor histidine kinase KdpD